MNIYLIGLPASGKSTCGKELAKTLNYTFVDLDKKIERDNNTTIPDIFKEGEEAFRTLETKALKNVMNGQNQVVSCGGGIVMKEINKTYMNGPIIYLECPLSELEFRISRDTSVRPVSQKIDIKTLYNLRKDKYDYFKDYTVKSLIVSKTVKEILKVVNKYENISH
jgi:shikimate kinase